jgi:hypothetical protein
MEGWGRWNSDGDIPDRTRHIAIENGAMAAADAARLIKERFAL